MRKPSKLSSVLAAISVLGTSGCAHAPTPTGLAAFARSTAIVRAQVDDAFTATDAVARDAAVDRFVTSGAIGLTEAPFAPAIDPQSTAAWDDALDGLQRYATLMASLTDEGRGAAMSGAVTDLGRELNTGHVGAGIDPGVGAGFATLAGVLVDASVRTRARELARRADPSIQALLHAMANAIGVDAQSGLRAVMLTNWTASLNGIRSSYAVAAQRKDVNAQHALVAQYLASLDGRDADLRALTSTRTSLLALADAHAAVAAGSAPGVQSVLDGIELRLAQTRTSFDELSKSKGK